MLKSLEMLERREFCGSWMVSLVFFWVFRYWRNVTKLEDCRDMAVVTMALKRSVRRLHAREPE